MKNFAIQNRVLVLTTTAEGPRTREARTREVILYTYFTGPRSACHSAESLFNSFIVYVNEHNSLGSPGSRYCILIIS